MKGMRSITLDKEAFLDAVRQGIGKKFIGPVHPVVSIRPIVDKFVCTHSPTEEVLVAYEVTFDTNQATTEPSPIQKKKPRPAYDEDEEC